VLKRLEGIDSEQLAATLSAGDKYRTAFAVMTLGRRVGDEKRIVELVREARTADALDGAALGMYLINRRRHVEERPVFPVKAW